MRRNLYNKYFSMVVSLNNEEIILTKNDINHFNKFIYPHIPKETDADIIDIGCGYGRYVKLLNDKGYKNAFGIDISEEQIYYAQTKFGLKNVGVADPIEFISNKLETYDTILLIDVLEHLEVGYSLHLIECIYNALKPSGLLIIQVPNALSIIPNHYGDVTHQRAYTTRSVEQTLRYGGFINYKHYPLPIIIHGFISLIRRFLSSFLIRPLLAIWMLIVFADRRGGIYTPNFLTVAKK